MKPSITSIHYCPVKSLSFQSIDFCYINKDYGGIPNDRIFAFSRGIGLDEATIIKDKPKERKLNKFLTLKNSPVLNKYNFVYDNEFVTDPKLTLIFEKKNLITINPLKIEERIKLANKIIELENSLVKPIFLLQNKDFPFYDTSHSNNVFNSISLININSILDFEKKINDKVEHQRFRGNFYVDGIEAWEERNWIGKTIKINDIFFKVEKNIPRCVAINLKPKTDDNSLNLLQSLKKKYDHFDMGIYLTPLNSGYIELENKVELNK